MTRRALRAAVRRILKAGLAAVEPESLVRSHIRVKGTAVRVAGVAVRRSQRIIVISVGKAAVPMARAAHRLLGERISVGVLIAPHRAPRLPRTQSLVAGHPLPDAAGIRASRHVIRLLATAGGDDLVLLLLSGGASALMPAPLDGVSLAHKQRITRLLLMRGASIAEMNAVRKRLSRLKGGGFARLASPARVVTLALSDVPGDDIATIGSGPTVDDPAAPGLARRTLDRFLSADEVPKAVRRALEKPPNAGATASRNRAVVIGCGKTFAGAAAKAAATLGFRTRVLPNALQGEASQCGPALVHRFAVWRRGRPSCLLATGETVVLVRGRGHGGRNQELALAAVKDLARLDYPAALVALATDGRDGRSTAAGGLVDDRTERLAATLGVSIRAALERNDSTAALRRLGGLIETGPTGTNVADVTVVLG